MTLFDLRAREERERAACSRVLQLFDHLGASELEDARALVSDPFRWFGKEIEVRAWKGGALVASNARAVPRPLLVQLSAQILDGAIDDDAILVLVDVARDERNVTCGAIVTGNELSIERVFDPALVREALEEIGSGARSS